MPPSRVKGPRRNGRLRARPRPRASRLIRTSNQLRRPHFAIFAARKSRKDANSSIALQSRECGRNRCAQASRLKQPRGVPSMFMKHSIAIALLLAAAGCDTDDNNRTDSGYRTTNERYPDSSTRYPESGTRTGTQTGAVSQDARNFVHEAYSG